MIDKSHIISSYTQFANNATNIISYTPVISPFTVMAQMTRAESNLKTFAIVCFCNIKHIKTVVELCNGFTFTVSIPIQLSELKCC